MSAESHQVENAPYLVFILIVSVFAVLILIVERTFTLNAEALKVLIIFDYAVCAVFLLDFFVCLRQAKNRWRYLVTWGWLDLLSVIPMDMAFRVARSSRIIRVVRLLRALRVARNLLRVLAMQRAQSGLMLAGVVTLVTLTLASVAILQVEHDAQSNIKDAEDAIWWSISTMTTVGYGDRYPVTSEGRLVASLLMITGVGLFGTLSGLLAAWFVAPQESRHEAQIDQLRRDIAELRGLLATHTPVDRSTTGASDTKTQA